MTHFIFHKGTIFPIFLLYFYINFSNLDAVIGGYKMLICNLTKKISGCEISKVTKYSFILLINVLSSMSLFYFYVPWQFWDTCSWYRKYSRKLMSLMCPRFSTLLLYSPTTSIARVREVERNRDMERDKGKYNEKQRGIQRMKNTGWE